MPGPLISLLWMLLCVMTVAALAYWFTKNVVGKRMLPGYFGSGENMKVLSVLNLGKNQRIAVVQVGKRYFLLGIAEQSISLLSELSQEEVSDWTAENTEKLPTFREALRENLQKRSRGDKK